MYQIKAYYVVFQEKVILLCYGRLKINNAVRYLIFKNLGLGGDKIFRKGVDFLKQLLIAIKLLQS